MFELEGEVKRVLETRTLMKNEAGAQAGAWGLPPSSSCLVFSRFCDIKKLKNIFAYK